MPSCRAPPWVPLVLPRYLLNRISDSVLHVIGPARKPGRPRLRDVAAAAGVSTATVSYVLNGTPGQSIRPQTQERVRRAADALGYVPHRVARTLREGRSRIVLLNVGDLLGSSMTSVIRGMT